MSTLYEITGDILQLQTMMEDEPENEYVKDTLESLSYDLNDKAEAICRVIRNMEANLAGFKNEIDRLSKRKKVLENSIDRLKKALFEAMQVTGTEKIKGDLFTIRLQNNAPQLPKDLKIENVPIDYLIERQYDIDRRALLRDIKEGKVEGIELEQSRSLRIS